MSRRKVRTRRRWAELGTLWTERYLGVDRFIENLQKAYRRARQINPHTRRRECAPGPHDYPRRVARVLYPEAS